MRKRTWPKGQRRAARVGFAQAHATALDGVRRVILVPSSRPRSPYRTVRCTPEGRLDELHIQRRVGAAPPVPHGGGRVHHGSTGRVKRTQNREWVVAYAYRFRVCRAGLLPMAMPITYTCTYIPYRYSLLSYEWSWLLHKVKRSDSQNHSTIEGSMLGANRVRPSTAHPRQRAQGPRSSAGSLGDIYFHSARRTSTTDLKANHSGIGSPARSI